VSTADDLTRDHHRLEDTRVTRRYFGKFAAITGHLAKVAAMFEMEGRLTKAEVEAIARYLVALNITFRALAHKYHFAGRFAHAGKLTFDRVDSGFPVYAELLQMAADATQASAHLAQGPGVDALKDDMVRVILSEQAVPTKLQYALSQRLYYEEMARGGLFWPRNDPEAIWLGGGEDGTRRRYLIRWAVYDSATNLPILHLMEVEDSGRTALPKDERRWPEVTAHLMAQAVGGLKLLTIATGFDADFDDLHPVRLRRFYIGPLHSAAFTLQLGPIHDVLTRARAPEGEDWALVWTEEDLQAERTEMVKSGWFGQVERQIYASGEEGYTRRDRFVLLPQRPYQALAELDPPGFRQVRKFVVGPQGRLMSYR
jgi:hypothetical protein